MPANPLRDDQGNVLPHDDASIANHGFLIRHINPEFHVCLDENAGCTRIASSAFSPTTGDPSFGMSCDIGQLLEEANLPEHAMAPHGFGAVRLKVESMRALSLKVGSDPEENNPYHGQAWGVKSRIRSKIHQVVIEWVVPIEGIKIR